MYSKLGKLKTYWHVIGLSKEVKKGRSLRRSLYALPVLIWRDNKNVLHAVADCCAHKKAPLEVKNYKANQLVCPYHGWEYDENGRLTHIPSAPQMCSRLNCSVPSYQLSESNGFIWIYLDSGQNPEHLVPNLNSYEQNGWASHFTTKLFETTEELLIDNFMDATHTPLVHDGLIRSSDSGVEHTLTVTTHKGGVLVDFNETKEKIGLGLNLLFGSSMKVKHTDEFLLPNLVKVIYQLNGKERFVALVACSPIEEGRTLVFVQLRYKFGRLNWLIAPFLSFFAKKILKQDFIITQKQYKNKQLFSDLKEQMTDYDYIANKVILLRKQMMENKPEIKESKTTISIEL